MADIKNLFEKQKGQEVLSNANLNKIGVGVESADYVKANIEDKKRFIPYIDFTSASNFARYGLAEKYYEDSIDYISNEYPYDGSLKEKIQWDLSASYLDRYIFENEYPRTYGYALIGRSYGTPGSLEQYGTFGASEQEYIYVKGSPHPATGSAPLRTNWSKFNLYNTSSTGRYNLEINGDNGLTIEFWLHKEDYNSSAESPKEVIFDLWNGGDYCKADCSTSSYGRFRVEITGGATSNVLGTVFNIELRSGSSGFSAEDRPSNEVDPIESTTISLSSSTPFTASWNHFALSFKNTGSEMQGQLYRNGQLEHSLITGSSISLVTGTMEATVGALVTSVSGTYGEKSAAKLSASLDEFRYWRRGRTAEQIGRHWFTQVGGGTNTDITNAATASTKYSFENPVDLGVYYKFNEGIYDATSSNVLDAVVLDYSGRTNNGDWTGYAAGSRISSSAIVEASASVSEFKDPIIFAGHPDVLSLRNLKKEEGRAYDYENNANIYHSFPGWIIGEDEDRDRNSLKDLTQILASYFDTLHLQIKDFAQIKNVRYSSGSDKPHPFANRLINSLGLISSDIFTNATDLEYLASRNDQKRFVEKLEDTKNKIYQNIYNNLSYIYKSKGTEKSFRNLIRCFGVGEELVNINLYGNDITYELRDNSDYRTIKKKYANFHNLKRFSSTVFQQSSSTNADSREYISSSIDASWGGNTYEAEAIFPTQLSMGDIYYTENDFVTASIFGCHMAPSSSAATATIVTSVGIATNDYVVITSTDGTERTYTAKTNNDYANNEFKADGSAQETATNLEACIKHANGHYGKITITKPDTETLVLTQVIAGAAGNTTITHGASGGGSGWSGATVPSSFTGGGAPYMQFGTGENDSANFQVQSVRSGVSSKDAYFQLTGTENYQLSKLTSSIFKDVYDDSKWNLSVRLKPSKYPLAPSVSGSNDYLSFDSFDLDFAGYNYVLDNLVNSFHLTSSVSKLNALSFLSASKRFFLGAHRTNFTGAVLQKSDAKISSLRVWQSHLDNDVLRAHARDAENFGVKYPFKNAYISQLSKSFGYNISAAPQMETLVLHWNFDTVTGSDASGEFIVADASSGSTSLTSRWGWFGSASAYPYQHTGLGYAFSASDTGSVSREYVYSAKQRLPETLNSSDMISLVDDSTNQMFTRDSRPIDYSFAFEKSMNTIVSEQMLNYFATIIAFNNLIGEPVNRYRQDYKDLEKLRALYFERVQNTPDFEKFVEFFKWIDSSLGTMLIQLAPASAHFSQKLRNVIESHVLERNKYWTKFPTLEGKPSVPEQGASGIGESSYNWSSGFATLPGSPVPTGSNCQWWLERAERTGSSRISSGDATIDAQREIYKMGSYFRTGSGPTFVVSRNSTTASSTKYEGNVFASRNFSQALKLVMNQSPVTVGGSNFPSAKRMEYITSLRSNRTLEITASDMVYDRDFDSRAAPMATKDCNDVIDPNLKKRLESKVVNRDDIDGYISGKGTIFAPFSLFSSSVESGYISDISTNFRPKTDITNYHGDEIGIGVGIALQGPFTEKHVGGRQHRHIDINTSASLGTTSSLDDALTRPEGWNLDVSELVLSITPPTRSSATQPRAIYTRDEHAKRPINIRNINWGTSSAVAGNYRKDYELIQTSGRTLNNKFFVENEGFEPIAMTSPYISGVIEYGLPDYSTTGSLNKYIFVERFNAPGGPEVSSRGSLDLYAEEYSVYNNLNYRNSIVRDALRGWYQQHCGQFGIQSVSGTVIGWKQPRDEDYGTLASYHKVHRNAASTTLYKSGHDREVEWIKLVNVTSSNYNRTIANTQLANWTSYAESDQIIEIAGYFEIEVSDIAATNNEWAVGISSNDYITDGTTFWDYSFYHTTVSAQCLVKEGSNTRATITIAVGDKLRILRDKTTVYYQHYVVSSNRWIDVWRSAVVINGNYYPRAAFKGNGSPSITLPRISNPRYDTWFIQHPIPQDALQYAWINDSYDKLKDQPLGYVSNFSVPSGSTTWSSTGSITASAIQFLSASVTGAGESYVDFAGINTLIYDPVTSSLNILSASGDYINAHIASITSPDDFNSLMLHRNGPYQYPSWKQIRTGEHPVARYQRRKNILSVMAYPRTLILRNGEGANNAGSYFNTRMDAYKQFIEPPVVFKYKPLVTTVGQPDSRGTLKLRHTYANNKCVFSQGPVTALTESGVEWLGHEPNSGSVADYLNIPEVNHNIQMYDLMRSDEVEWNNAVSTLYSEVVYPREANTGLAKIRGRPKYTEYASGTLNPDGTFSASYTPGSNGVDRGPLERRTFWRNSPRLRNRRAGFSKRNGMGAPIGQGPREGYAITGVLPNSQGYFNGYSTSLWPFGTAAPRFYIDGNFQGGNDASCSADCGAIYGAQGDVNSQALFSCSSNVTGGFFGTGDYAHIYNLPQKPDFGELNSFNYQVMAGFAGTAYSSSFRSLGSSLASKCTWYPTASAYYYHKPIIRRYMSIFAGLLGSHFFTAGMKYQTAELASSSAWFDSYEEYAKDIRGLGKNFTTIPEFRISDHMDYYVHQKSGDFKVINDKFLSFDGAAISSSAVTQSVSGGTRGFNKTFFRDYSNSDFQKYFGKFNKDSGLNKITLKCKGIKKLLPYYGFYPQTRTLQLAAMFSQSLGPYISGINWQRGQSTDTAVPESGALAVQSLLQPYFAPGILYNTIKSGIAVSWPTYTGSNLDIGMESSETTTITTASATAFATTPNFNIHFEALLDPINKNGLPNSNYGMSIDETQAAKNRMFLLIPTYQTGNITDYKQTSSQQEVAFSGNVSRKPYVELVGQDRIDASNKNGPYGLYTLAMSNFLAEIPNFFLSTDNPTGDDGGKFKTIVSTKTANEVKGKLTAGQTYFMDIYLRKEKTLLMVEETPYYGGYTEGRLFGPPVAAGTSSLWTGSTDYFRVNDTSGEWAPGYAPYTPPYFYGESRVTLEYTPDADQISNFTYETFLSDVTASFLNPSASLLFEQISGSTPKRWPAEDGMMQISSSINFKGVFTPPEVDTDAAGNITNTKGTANSALSRWVISPKMETPVLNFSDNPIIRVEDEYVGGIESGHARGMWAGYGKMPTGSAIEFGIDRTIPTLSKDEAMTDPTTGSLIDVMFDGLDLEQQGKKKVGEMATEKKISEAIIAIPYVEEREPSSGNDSELAYFTRNPILGKYFFALGEHAAQSSEIFHVIRENITTVASPPMAIPGNQESLTWAAQFGKLACRDCPPESIPTTVDNIASPDAFAAQIKNQVKPRARTSISDMALKMKKYMIPPELDFNTYDGGPNMAANGWEGGHDVIEPFVMYIMEFEHTLDRQDLIDIWQGLMPKISKTAEEAIVEVTHETGPLEFFNGRKIPENVRWMVFKVKKKANLDYYKVTSDSSDDVRFNKLNKFSVKNNEIIYNYNWPYDQFSLVELAQLEIENEFRTTLREVEPDSPLVGPSVPIVGGRGGPGGIDGDGGCTPGSFGGT